MNEINFIVLQTNMYQNKMILNLEEVTGRWKQTCNKECHDLYF